MKINGTHLRTIRLGDDGASAVIIDQTKLPHRFEMLTLTTAEEAAHAILTMQVRGAPLIGATAAYGLAMALLRDASDAGLSEAIAMLAKQRPTAVNLRWALEEMRREVAPLPASARAAAAFTKAAEIADDDVETCRRIGANGLDLIRAIAAKNNVLVDVQIMGSNLAEQNVEIAKRILARIPG